MIGSVCTTALNLRQVNEQLGQNSTRYIDFIKPGKPFQNGYVERLNRTYREDVLDLYLFNNLDEVRQITDDGIQLYNHERPHDGLNDMTPIEYLNVA